MSAKIRTAHLARPAVVYIRQSTLMQVLEHRESTQRQYDLAALAERLGWDPAQILVIDEDLGKSGKSAENRSGFQRLAAEVSLGRVGAILSLEVSRLARSSADWHRLLDLCALSDTLILDDDGVYDPNDFNDRLVLGMKGTMSDAERHLMRLRLFGGKLHKAKKGELGSRLRRDTSLKMAHSAWTQMSKSAALCSSYLHASPSKGARMESCGTSPKKDSFFHPGASKRRRLRRPALSSSRTRASWLS